MVCSMAALSHWQLPAFRDLHLEESSVFSIRESDSEIGFEMEFVLNERHARFSAPLPNQQHCYRRGRMTFHDVTEVKWTNKRTELSAEPGEQGDLGKVDSFLLDTGTYKLKGPWGRLELRAASVNVDVW